MIDKDSIADIDDAVLIGAGILVLLVIVGGFAVFAGDIGDYSSSEVDFDYPEWADDDGITSEEDLQMAMMEHSENLQSDSYTIEANVAMDSEEADGTEESTFSYQFNAESQTGLGVQSFEDTSMEYFDDYAEQEQLLADGPGTDNATYERMPLQQPPFAGDMEIAEFINVVELEATGVEEGPSGEDVVVYEVVGVVDDFEDEIDIDGEFHLSENGYFTYLSLDIYEAEQGVESSQELTFKDIGSTTVDEPDWLDEADEEADEIDEEDLEGGEEDVIIDPETGEPIEDGEMPEEEEPPEEEDDVESDE